MSVEKLPREAADQIERILQDRLGELTGEGFADAMTVLGLVASRIVFDNTTDPTAHIVAATMMRNHIITWTSEPSQLRD